MLESVVRTLLTPIEALKRVASFGKMRQSDLVRTLLTPIEALKLILTPSPVLRVSVRTLLTPIEALKLLIDSLSHAWVGKVRTLLTPIEALKHFGGCCPLVHPPAFEPYSRRLRH